ncbi:TIGR02099 family protein [Candidatus Methylospira mobilis]|uniref:TIGR02099 family protein n=1 Tax=Candidatus Methylospira mobilis TaxID=1808979 RepID=A0A5Q0BFM8_9GAMM|nr:YhdP family protein [Candidatus Methylospira mobilis]QFY42663.1 TIGR02099 family protein [Candidatus Methylospira mobilis]WNV04219.1 YhdP family protein [Candidatus Methylospira mobilis]
MRELKFSAAWRFLAYLLVAVLVSGAMLLTAARLWLLPHIQTYKPEIEARLSSMIQETLQVGDVSAALHGLDLRLMLRDCSWMREDGLPSAYDARRVAVTVDVIASLFALRPIIGEVEIEGVRLIVHTLADGSIGVLGISAKSESPAWLSTIKNLRLRDVTLGWQNDQAEIPQYQAFGKADIEFHKLGDLQHRLALKLDPDESIGDSLYFTTQVRGELFTPASWQGRFYLEGVGIKPDLWRNAHVPFNLQAGVADLRLWGDFNRNKLQYLAGQLALQHPELSYADDKLRLGRLGAIFNWHQLRDSSELIVKRLAFAPPDKPDSNNRLSMRMAIDAQGNISQLGAVAENLQLDEVNALTKAVSSMDQHSRSVLTALSPVGRIHDVRMFYDVSSTAWAVCGSFSDIGFNSSGKIPGISDLSGRLCGDNERGTLNLAIEDGRVFGDELWSKPLAVKEFSAQVDWLKNQRELILSGRDLAFRHRESKVRFGFDYIAPSDAAQLPVLNLLGQGDGFRAEHIAELLPLFAMDKNAAQWLNGAFVSGQLSDLRFLFRGAVEQFPFDGAEGIFETSLKASGLQLHYDPHWPDLHNVQGWLLLKNAGYFAEIEQGTVEGFPLTPVRVAAPEYLHHPWVYVEGGFGGNLSAILAALERTPEKQLVDRLNWFGHPAGRADFDLKLRLPLDVGIGDGEVNGRLSLNDAHMDIDLNGASRGRLSRLTGEIHFSGNDITAQAVKGQLFGGPLSIGLEHEAGRVMLTAQGRLQAAELGKYFPHALWSHVSGETPYTLDLSFPAAIDAPGAADDIRVKVLSDLVGIESRLPMPFAKSRLGAQALAIEWDKLADTRSLMNVFWGQDKKARFYFADELQGFDISLGAAPLPAISEHPLRRFRADFTEFNMTPWSEFLHGGNIAGGGGLMDNLPDNIHIRLQKLEWQGKAYGPLLIDADRKGNYWSGALDTLYGAGRFDYTHDSLGAGALNLDLDRITLPSGAGISNDPMDPSLLPSIKAHSRSVDWQGHDLGVLTLEAEHWMHGLNVSRFKLLSPYSVIQMRGSWMKQGSGSETRFSGTLNADNLGSVIENLGFTKEVRDTPTKSTFSLAWTGGPHQFTPATLVGDMSFSLGRGSLLNIDPGLGRAAILLNLDTLRRLLLFDFKDLFGQGLTYDSIRGKYRFEHGQAVTQKLLIDAVVAEIAISGRVGLVARDFDQRVDVMPHALAALPFAGALVPGVVVGTAVNMAEFLAGKDEASLTSNHYVIKGSWDNPKVYRAEGSLPIDMLGRAWSDLKEVSGFGKQEEK